MRGAAVLILAAVYAVFGCPDWLAERSLRCALSYPLFHANIFHLAVNLLSLCMIYSPGKKGNGRDMILAYLISIAVYPLSAKPLVGISNMLFATTGMRTPALSSRWWRSSDVIFFLAVMTVFLFIPSVSAVTHIVSFAAGVGLACMGRSFKKTMKDVKRIERMG